MLTQTQLTHSSLLALSNTTVKQRMNETSSSSSEYEQCSEHVKTSQFMVQEQSVKVSKPNPEKAQITDFSRVMSTTGTPDHKHFRSKTNGMK